VQLLAQPRDLGAEREDVLDRPVVEVEAQPPQAALRRLGERFAAGHVALHERGPLERRAEHRGRLREKRLSLRGCAVRDEHGVSALPAGDDGRPWYRLAGERGSNQRLVASRRLGPAMDMALDAVVVRGPQRDGVEVREREQRLDLDRRQREQWQREQVGVDDRLHPDERARSAARRLELGGELARLRLGPTGVEPQAAHRRSR
jgi:hypothetical protein